MTSTSFMNHQQSRLCLRVGNNQKLYSDKLGLYSDAWWTRYYISPGTWAPSEPTWDICFFLMEYPTTDQFQTFSSNVDMKLIKDQDITGGNLYHFLNAPQYREGQKRPIASTTLHSMPDLTILPSVFAIRNPAMEEDDQFWSVTSDKGCSRGNLRVVEVVISAW